MTDSNPSSSDESLEKLLRRVSETPAVLDLRRPLRPGDRIASGRIRVVEELGKGGMGQVFAAYDEEKAARVALKVIGRVTPQAIIHLKREFRIASELVHPHIVRLHELFRDGTEWFFTMDLVHGTPLPELLSRLKGPARIELTRTVVLQLADALHAVHQFGSVHGDLKPANFLVDDTMSPPRVVLLDFGLARPIGNGEGGGTLGYMAPEQIFGDAVAESADWYSLGVVLHEALSGEIPRAGALSTALESAPPDLVALCRALLARRPQDRPTGPQVLKTLGVPLPSDSSRQSMPSGVRLVGRHEELTRLRGFRASSPDSSTSVVFVHGPSGIGKTALLEHFIQIERTRGAIVLRGRCRENESIGYKAIDGVVDDLVGVLSEMTDTEATSILPRSLWELVQLFPALRGSNVIAQAVMDELQRGDQTMVRQRAIAGFAELLGNLAAFGPLVMWIDDLQWSDRESALILGPMLGGADPVPLFFIGSYRSENADRVPVIAGLYADDTLRLPRPDELALGPLSPESAEAMALAILPGDMPDLAAKARDIGRNAAGLPLFIAELAHSWRTTPEATLGDAPVSLSSVVGQRVARLSPAALSLLELVAIAGGPISRAALKQARRLRSTELDEAVDVLRASQLIVTKGLREEHTVDIRHDRLRELVSRDIGDAKRRQHHLNLAVVLDSSGGKPEEIATHYQGAGDVMRAGKYWLAAADDAAKKLGFRKAAEFYSRALERAGLDEAERYRVQLRRAQMLAYCGESQLAAELYLFVATSRARDEATELRRLAAEQLLLSGHISQGMRLIDEVLTATRLPRTRGGRAALPSVVIGRMRLRLRGLRFQLRSETELSREELSRLDVSWTIASSMGFVDFIRGADFQNRHLLLALKAGEPRRLVRALALEALNSAALTRGSQRRTEQLLQAAESLVDKTPDRDTALGLRSRAASRRICTATRSKRWSTAPLRSRPSRSVAPARCGSGSRRSGS